MFYKTITWYEMKKLQKYATCTCSQVLRRQTTHQEIPIILIDLSILEATLCYNRIKISKPKVYN